MSEVIEVAFEEIPPSDVVRGILLFSGAEKNIGSVEIQGLDNPPKVSGKDLSPLIALINEEETFSVFINLAELSSPHFTIKNCSLMVVKERDSFSFILIFEEDDLSLKVGDTSFITALHGWALEFKDTIKASSVYCGLDPASDEDTRFFTNSKLGPLF